MEQLIQSYYQAILRVDPTDSQIARWLNLIDENNPEPGIDDLTTSLFLQAEEVLSIMRVYQVVLGRTPDSGGLDFWVQVFRDMQEANPEMTYREALVEAIRDWLSSDEFVAVYGDDLSDEEYVALLYVNVLGREPDPAGFNFWLSELENEVITREELVIAFSESEEFKASVDDDAAAILLYDAQVSSEDTIDDPEHRVENDDPYAGELQNEAPTDILIGTDVDEDAENGDLVNEGQLTAVDRDAGETFTWELIDPSGAFGLDDPNAVQPNIIVVDASKLDHETAEVMTVTIRVTDSAGNTYEEEVQIDVNDVNEAPTDILPEGPIAIDDPEAVDAAGDVVTTLTAVDEDEGDSHTFRIVSQTVDDAFDIPPNSNELQVLTPSLLGTGIHEITIEVKDSGGETTQRTITIDLSELNEDGDDYNFTLDQDIFGGTDRNDTYVASSGDGDGNGRTANGGDSADGGDGYDRFQLTREDDSDPNDVSIVTGVSLKNIELVELINKDDSSDGQTVDPEQLDWGSCPPFINMPGFGPNESSNLVFIADESPNIDTVAFRDSKGNVTIADLQEEFWTTTEGDDTDTGPTVNITDVTANRMWVDSDIQSKQFQDEDGDGKDDGEIVFNVNEVRINELRITENAEGADLDGTRGEQVGTITINATGVPSVIGSINNGDGDDDATGSTTHTLNINVSDLTNSRPSSALPDAGGLLAAANTDAIDFFAGQDDGLGDGLNGLETVNISGGGDVFLLFNGDDNVTDEDGDGFTLDITDGEGNSFFMFEPEGFVDVKLDGGDGFDTLIVDYHDLVDHPDALDNVTNIERVIVLDTQSSDGGGHWHYDDDGMRSYLPAIDQCLFGDDGDDQQVGGMGNDFLDAGHGGTDVQVGDHQPFYYVTRVAFDSDDANVSDDDTFEITVDWDGDGVADYTASYTYNSADDTNGDGIEYVVDTLEGLLEANQPDSSNAHIGDSNTYNSLYFQQPGDEGSAPGILSATVTNNAGVTEDLPMTYNWTAGSDIFVAGARDIEDFTDGFDNDKLPEDVDGLMEAAGLSPDSDGADEGADGVVYVLDFNQGSHGDYASTPGNEAYNANEADLLAFRDSEGNLDECGSATNYEEVQGQGVERDDADANAFNAFASNDGLRYYVNARSFEDALQENTGLVWGVDVNQNIIDRALEDLADGTDDGITSRPGLYSGSSQDLIDMIGEAKADSWLRVYYNEPGTDGTPEAVFELVGLDNISQFSFDDIGGAECIEDKTDPFEYVLC